MNEGAPKQEQQDVIADHFEELKQIEMMGYEPKIRKARNALFVVAVLLLLGEIISANANNIPFSPLLLLIVGLECGSFVALGFWANTRPFTAITLGLVLFIGLWVFAIVATGFQAAIGGILIRIIVITYLVSALKDAKAWEDAKGKI
ncbi:MAG: hypothetical protein IPP93_12290 [Chitinophagaceae bacterium]|nr:hypothetical protein [Chitinophagaceae bacterium]MBL0336838.1 hypothetical protein [Chitinophagaceae bacterium]